MDRDDLLKSLKAASKSLNRQFTRDGMNWLTHLLANKGVDYDRIQLGPDTLYEFGCFLALARALHKRADATQYIESPGRHGHRLAYSHASKSNFAFFRFKFGATIVDLCCQCELPVTDNPSETPDLTLQSVKSWNSADRSVGDLVGMWEVKYHDKKRPLNKLDVAQIAGRFDVLSVTPISVRDKLSRYTCSPFNVHALLTNAPRAKFNLPQRLNKGFSIVFQYMFDSSFVVEPTRSEHLSFRRARKVP